MPPGPKSAHGPAALRERIRRELEREQRRLAWIERGPATRQVLAARGRILIAAYEQLDRELSALRDQDEAGFTEWLERTARLGAVMKSRRLWPWWVYTRLAELAGPMAPATRKDKRGAG